ncbi:MAG: hypothetical protein ACHQUC_03675 [Chlamydiales bacterium]
MELSDQSDFHWKRVDAKLVIASDCLWKKRPSTSMGQALLAVPK